MLRDLDVLVLDCQATGATPVHGDLLELGWTVSHGSDVAEPPRAKWIAPKSDRGVSNIVRKLTGWSDAYRDEAVDASSAWSLLRADAARVTDPTCGPAPTVIHFARFELPFLRELHASSAQGSAGAEPFPFDTVCLHAIAQRLFPDLPRRSLRALAGHLGHSPELVRRSAGHVEASAFIWRALLPALEAAGARTWDELKAWLDTPASAPGSARGSKRTFPLPAERRRALPDAPGVYRFLRPNGDVLYVGKAASLKKRVASHFTAASRTTRELALEMLTQAHDVDVTLTATPLEAALLETDEIKRIDPPYNVQLRGGDRLAWFASGDWQSALAAPNDEHRVGPLPSQRALSSIAAMRSALEGIPLTPDLRAAMCGVPLAFAPPVAMFDEVWGELASAELRAVRETHVPARTRIMMAARRIVVAESADDAAAEPPPSGWDRDRVRRALERAIVQEGSLVDRARALSLLSTAIVAFREPKAERGRLLVIEACEIVARHDVADASLEGVVAEAARVAQSPTRRPSRIERQSAFDAARYDRVRVLATELRRIRDQGGAVVVRVPRRPCG